MIKIVQGNILDAPEDILVQQVNCRGVMGSGLAKQIKIKYPEVYKEYKHRCKEDNPESLLGFSQLIICNDGKFVVNLFGQLDYGRNKLHTIYSALKNSLKGLKRIAEYNKKSVAIPYGIGCGLGGGDWNIVYGIIEEVFGDYDVTIYKLD